MFRSQYFSWIYVLPLVCLLLLALAWGLWREPPPVAAPPPRELTLLCEPGLRMPLDAIVTAFARRYGVRVMTHYGAAVTLIERVERDGQGDDLMLIETAGDALAALRRGLVSERHSVALPESLRRASPIEALVLVGASQPDLALTFVRFLSGPAAQDAFRRFDLPADAD